MEGRFMRAAIYVLSLAGATTLVVVTPCAAQAEVEPFAGLYNPIAPLATIPTCPPGLPCPSVVVPLTETQDRGFTVGARLTDWTNQRVGLDFSLRHSEGSVTTGGRDFPVTSGSMGFALKFPRAARDASSPTFELVGGVGFVARTGAAFASARVGPAQTDWGPVVGGGLRSPLTRRLALRCDIEDFLYWFDAYAYPFDGYGFLASHVEHDLLLSAGLAIQVGRIGAGGPDGQ
jgi:hypothetical protein